MSGKAVRRLWISVGMLFGVLFAAVAVGLFLVYSDTGSGWLLERVSSRLPEGLTVQSFAGTVAGPFEVIGVDYAVGPLRIRVERAQVYWRPWSLLDHCVQFDSVRVTGALVRWDTASTAAQEEPPEATAVEGPGWRVTWEQLSVSGAVFEGPQGIRLYDAELASGGHLDSFSVLLRALAEYDTTGGLHLLVAGRGSLEHIDFDELVLSRDSTRMVISGKVGWRPTVSWSVVARVSDLNPADWFPHSGRLTGLLHLVASSEGSTTDGAASVALAVDTLTGTMAGLPVTGRASLWMHDDTIRIDSTFIEWGGLVARAQGVVADTVRLSWEANVPDLSLWSDRLGGNLRTQGEAHGPKGDLTVQASLVGGRLRFDEHSAETVAAECDFEGGGRLPSRLGITAHKAVLWGEALDTIAIEAEGTQGSHIMNVRAAGPVRAGTLRLNGGYDSLWNGQLEALEFSEDSLGSWILVQPAAMLAGRDTLAVSSLCLEGARGRLCLDVEAGSLEAWQLSARLDSLATDWLCNFASDGFVLDSRLSGEVRVNSSEGQELTVMAQVALAPGRLTLQALPTDTIASDLMEITLNWTPEGGILEVGGGFTQRGLHTPFEVTGRLPGTPAVLSRLREDLFDWRTLEWSGTLDVRPLSLAWLDAILPSGTNLDGEASVKVVAASVEGGRLVGECTIELPPGRMIVWTGTDSLLLNWSASLFSLRADSAGLVALAHSALSMDGRDVGTLELDVRSESSFALGEDPLTVPLHGTMAAQFDLAPLQPFVAGVSGLSGSFQVGATLTGTLGELDVEGSLELAAEAFLPDLGIQLTQVKLNMNAAGGRTIVTGSALSGGGALELSGDISRLPSRESPSRLRVQGKNFLASDTRQARVWLTPDLELAMFGDSLDLSGRIDVPKAHIEIARLPEQAVAVSEDEVIVGDTLTQKGPGLPFWSRFTLALGDDVFFKGFDVTAFLSGSLDIRQSPGAPAEARGEVVLRDGRYRGMGQDLQIDPGRLVFSGSLMHPAIEVLAFRRASDHTRAGFKVSGRLPDPQVDLYSDPMKPENDITSYILFGRSSSEGSDTERMKASQAAALVGGNLLASTAAMQIGLDEARIDPGYTGNDAALVAGKYISPQLFVGYGQGLFETLHTLRVRYILSTHISLEAETGTRETADVIYQIERGE